MIPEHLQKWCRPSVASDITELKDNLRQEDILEIQCMSGNSPAEALALSLTHSQIAITAVLPWDRSVIVGMGGLVRPCMPWFLFREGFPNGHRESREFLIASRKICDWLLAQAHSHFGWNVTSTDSKRNRRWLKWLGATELPANGNAIPFYFNGGQCV